jgi:hypothetical protein
MQRICLLLGLIVAACTRSSVPIPTSPVSPTEPPIEQELPVITHVPEAISDEATYALVWIKPGDVLRIRQPAGISGSVVDTLAHDLRGVHLTGEATRLGSSTWVEILRPLGGTGWINTWNITEYVTEEQFCADAQVAALIENFVLAMEARDGDRLASLVSPKRGLVIRHDWWNPEVTFNQASIHTIFDSIDLYHWGFERDSELAIEGTFNQIIPEQLLKIFNPTAEIVCNSLKTGTTGREVEWPEEYSNLRFYAFHQPAFEPGNQLNWKTWVVAVEYVEGVPYLTLLVGYKGEI